MFRHLWRSKAAILLISLSSFLQVIHAAANCSAGALFSRVSNTTIGSPNEGRPMLFGLEMKVGRQVFVPFVNAHASDIHIKSTDKSCKDADPTKRPLDCVPVAGTQFPTTNESLQQKEYMLGGFFDGEISDTYHGPHPWRGSQENITFIGSDNIVLGDSPLLNLYNHTFRSGYNTFAGTEPGDFELSNNDSWTPAYIGLNKDSSLLNELYNTGRIPSRSWGFFNGWREYNPGRPPQNGSLVLGGYDAAKIDGSIVNYPIPNPQNTTDRCQLQITINKMWVSLGSEEQTKGVSTFTSKQKPDGFFVCIDPSYTAIQVPTLVRARLMQQMQDLAELQTPLETIPEGVGIGIPPESQVFFGNLSLTFNFGGINITIPSERLLHPPQRYTSEGLRDSENLSGYKVVDVVDGGPFVDDRRYDVGPKEHYVPTTEVLTNEPPILFGYPFLAAVYLFVNHDNDTFSLAPAIKELSRTSTPIPVLAQECPGAVNNGGNSTSPDPLGPKTPDPSSTNDVNERSKLKPAYIAGIAVGGVLWFVALVVIFIFWRRRIHKRHTPPSPPEFEHLEADSAEVPVMRYEADGRQIQIIPGINAPQMRPCELEGCTPIFEMDGDFDAQKLEKVECETETKEV